MSDDGYTISIPFCDECPPYRDWSRTALILGRCPDCGRDHPKAWRALIARGLIRDLGGPY